MSTYMTERLKGFGTGSIRSFLFSTTPKHPPDPTMPTIFSGSS